MPVIAQYIIESSLCLLAFYGLYWLMLKRQKMFAFQRIYLLAAICLALMIPGFHVELEVAERLLFGQSEEFRISAAEDLINRTPDFQLTSADLLLLIYFLGVVLVGFRRLDAIWKLLEKYEKQNQKVIPESQALYFKNVFPATSFFTYTFWNNYQSTDYQIFIIKNSSFKIRPWHAWEVILMEILIIGYWFNPLIYWFKNQLNNTHQNIIDEFIEEEKIEYGNPLKEGIEIPEKINKTFSEIKKEQQKRILKTSGSIVAGSLLTLILGALFALNFVEKTPLQKPIEQTAFGLSKFGSFVFYEYHQPKTPIKKLVWGNAELELEKVASPNGYTSSVEIELEDFQKLLDSEIEVFSGEQKLNFPKMDLVVDIANERGHLWFPNVQTNDIKFEHRRYGDMRYKIMRGDIISISGMAEGHFLASVTFKIIDPLEIYRPPISVPSISKKSPKFGFQVIPQKGKKTLVRLDTTKAETKHILDLYTDENRYHIIHLPDFQTHTRLISEKENLFWEENLTEEYLSISRFDRFFLPEFQTFPHQEIQLNWGEMTAEPSSQNYNLEDFRKSRRAVLNLNVDSLDLEIASFRLTVFKNEKDPIAYHLDKISKKEIQNILRKIPEKTSLYFDEIIVEKDSVFKYLPFKFVFNIGAATDKFELEIVYSDSVTTKKSRREPQLIEFESYPMSELIALLTDNERMEFENQNSDPDILEPHFDIYFKSDFVDPKRGESLILKHLRQQYYYSSNLRYETRMVWIIMPPKNTEKLDSLEYFYHIAPNLEKIIEANNEKGLDTLTPGFFDELAQVIESNFEVTVFNESELTKAYGLGLDLSSFENLRKQLKEDYGIEMMMQERVVKVVRVVY